MQIAQQSNRKRFDHNVPVEHMRVNLAQNESHFLPNAQLSEFYLMDLRIGATDPNFRDRPVHFTVERRENGVVVPGLLIQLNRNLNK